MAKRKKFVAQFPNGDTATRSSESRVYQAAWRVVWRGKAGREWDRQGFSGNWDLAKAELARVRGSIDRHGGEILHAMIAPAVQAGGEE